MGTELRDVTRHGWRKHLSTDVGQEGMLVLREKTPTIVKGSPETMIFDAGRATGWKECLDAILNLLALEKPKDVKVDND